MLPKIQFKIDFKTNFSAFIIYLFEEFPGCTEDALSKINKLRIKKEIDKIKRKETLEDDENFLKELSKIIANSKINKDNWIKQLEGSLNHHQYFTDWNSKLKNCNFSDKSKLNSCKEANNLYQFEWR